MFNKEISFYGSGTIGEKGQIVIPVKAREEFEIQTGDELIFFGHGPMMHIVKANQINKILEKLTQSFEQKIKGFKKSLKRNK